MATSPDVLAQVVPVSPWPDELVQVDAHPNPEDHYEAALWARQLLSRSDWVVVDTETTGLGATDQVVQVSVVDPSGRSLVDTLVQPTCEIHPMASKVHRLDRKKVASAPTYDQVHGLVSQHLAGRLVLAYNATFVKRLLAQTASAWHLVPAEESWECVMVRYAQYLGSQRWPGSDYTWHKLPRSAPVDDFHGARDDCLMTLTLIQRMANPRTARIRNTTHS